MYLLLEKWFIPRDVGQILILIMSLEIANNYEPTLALESTVAL